jgi:hypothetical protein
MGQSRLNTFLKVVSATVVGISICQPVQAQSGHGHGGHHQSTSSWQFTPNTSSLYANQPFTISGTVGFQNNPTTSLYANQPFTISGTVGFQNNPTTVGLHSNFNSRSCLATPRRSFYGNNGSGFGVIPGLAIVAPGWAGYPFGGYGYSGYGVGYSGWGNNNYYSRGYYLNNGFNPWINPFPIWGFNGNQNWNGNGFVLNNGFFGAMNEVVERGNARFGPARPVRQQKAQNRNGMQVLPMQNQGGLNAIAPRPIAAINIGPNDPLRPPTPQPDLDAQFQLARADQMASRIIEPTIPPRTVRPPMPRSVAGEGRKPKALFPVNATLAQKHDWIVERLQTGDRLARNGVLDEARERYETLAKTMTNQAGPWLRIAQIEVLAGRPDQALLAWQEAARREAGTVAGYSKLLKWTDIADQHAISQARKSLDNWLEQESLKDLVGLRATIRGSEVQEVAITP